MSIQSSHSISFHARTLNDHPISTTLLIISLFLLLLLASSGLVAPCNALHFVYTNGYFASIIRLCPHNIHNSQRRQDASQTRPQRLSAQRPPFKTHESTHSLLQ
ncbi:hypothetical protein F5882DRAFT_402093 [Hyaloscypha sp. PMI_1271]|nr:hypothetical protein F5882DRAFT_402093 [Hyaloscypha sp. PMI_1271]